jgi:putative flippase GtrA
VQRLPPTLLACVCGLLTTGLDVIVLSTLVERGVAIALASAIGASVGAVAGFLGNKYIAFRDRSPLALRQVVTFAAVALASAALMALAMQIVAVHLGVPYLLAKAICAVGLFFAWSLPAQRRLVFAQRKDVSARPPSIEIRSPVIQPASSLTRKAARAATSSAVPGRPSGWVWRERSRNAA